jgi:hypothetical protein
MSFEPHAKRRKARLFNSKRHDGSRWYCAALAQEVDEPERAAPPMRRPRGFNQLAALATDWTAAVMPRESLDDGVVHIAPSDAGQTKPSRKMLGFGAIAAPTLQTISDGFEMVGETCEMAVDAFDIGNDWDVAPVLQKADETANAGEILRGLEFARAVAAAATAMSREVIDSCFIHAGDWDAASVEPKQEMTCGAAVTGKRRPRTRTSSTF